MKSLKSDYPCSRGGLDRMARENFRSVTSVQVIDGHGCFSVMVNFKWWARLVPFLRRRVARNLEFMIEPIKPVGIEFFGVEWR